MQLPAFSKQNSLAIKGVAIMMMLWHHCFLSGRFENYTISFWPLSQSQVVNIADFFIICVSLFAFVSGYGLFLSFQVCKKQHRGVTQWLREKLVRTLSGYWFVVVLAWIVCTILDNRPYTVYGFADSKYAGVWMMCVEFLGLSNFFGSPELNATWWYMSAAVAFIVLLPILDKCFEWVGCFCTMCLIFIVPRMCGGYPSGINFLSFLPALCCGMIFAKKGLFEKWQDSCKKWADGRMRRVIYSVILSVILLLVYKLYYHLPTKTWWDVKYGLIPMVVILFIFSVLIPFQPVNACLVFLGKHATNIFLTHTFIRYYYCQDFIYGRGHFMAVIGTLALTSLALSPVIELLKKLIKYDVLIDRISGVYTDKLTEPGGVFKA